MNIKWQELISGFYQPFAARLKEKYEEVSKKELLKEENQMLTKNVSVEHLETLLKRNILLRRENVIITPHIAFDSMEAIERILDTTVENIISFFEGKNYHKVI